MEDKEKGILLTRKETVIRHHFKDYHHKPGAGTQGGGGVKKDETLPPQEAQAQQSPPQPEQQALARAPPQQGPHAGTIETEADGEPNGISTVMENKNGDIQSITANADKNNIVIAQNETKNENKENEDQAMDQNVDEETLLRDPTKKKVPKQLDPEEVTEMFAKFWGKSKRKDEAAIEKFGPSQYHHWGEKNEIFKRSPTLRGLSNSMESLQRKDCIELLEKILGELKLTYTLNDIPLKTPTPKATPTEKQFTVLVILRIEDTVPTLAFRGRGFTRKEAHMDASLKTIEGLALLGVESKHLC